MLHLAATDGRLLTHRHWGRCEIVDGEFRHARMLAERVRPLDRDEMQSQGLGPYTVLRRSFRASLWCRTAFIDGEIAAMFGLGGQAMGLIGLPWLITSGAIERMPVTFVKEARKGVADMLACKPYLENHVLASYRGACRLLEVLGFGLDAPAPYGPQGVLFRRFHMSR